MAAGITYLWKLTAYSFSITFRVFGYRLSTGFWFRLVKGDIKASFHNNVSLINIQTFTLNHGSLTLVLTYRIILKAYMNTRLSQARGTSVYSSYTRDLATTRSAQPSASFP